MEETTLGSRIAALRKEKGMTQRDLAEKLNVTDKAVSKWERDLSCPDVKSIPRLAACLGVRVEELMTLVSLERTQSTPEWGPLGDRILGAVALAMGVAAVVLGITGWAGLEERTNLLGIGMACLGLRMVRSKKE